MLERSPNKFDFDGRPMFQLHKKYCSQLPSGDITPPRPVKLVHFMQPFCETFGVPSRNLLIQLQEERPLNTFLEFREAVMKKKAKPEATGKSIVAGWSIGVDRDLKDDSFDIFGSSDELVQSGFEIICPFTTMSMYDEGKTRKVLTLIGSDEESNFELYETLIRMKMDEFSNLQNSERIFELLLQHEPKINQLVEVLRKREKGKK